MIFRLAIAAAAVAAAPGPAAFSHAPRLDAFGYYMPTRTFSVGPYRLEHLHIGAPEDLAAWERGKRLKTYAPVMMVFSDTRSPMATNELGGRSHKLEIRVMPTAYKVAPGRIAFNGFDARIGRVSLDAVLDKAALDRAKAGDAAAVVIRATVRVGGLPERPVAFTWFGGD